MSTGFIQRQVSPRSSEEDAAVAHRLRPGCRRGRPAFLARLRRNGRRSLHYGINARGIARSDSQADAAKIASRQALRQLAPGAAAIGGFINSAAGTVLLGGVPARESIAPHLPSRRI